MIEITLPIIKQFENGNVIVFNNSDINKSTMKFDSGYLYTLYGNNGTGKTTLINMLSLLTKSLFGASFKNEKLFFDNTEINKNINNTLIRENHLSFIFQDPHIINIYTLEENLNIVNQYFNYESDLNEIINKSKKLNIEKESSDYLIKKLNKFLNEKNNTPYYLSGGEKQLISFIRSMIKPSNITFADEPWASMDKHLKSFIESQLYLYLSDQDIFSDIRNRNRQLKEKKIVIIISHSTQNKSDQKQYGEKDLDWRYTLPVFNKIFDKGINKNNLKSWIDKNGKNLDYNNLQKLIVERYKLA